RRHSAADQGFDAVEEAGEAELEGAGRVGGGAVLGAGRAADAAGDRVPVRVEHGGQQRAVPLPPLLVGDAGLPGDLVGSDRAAHRAVDVVGDQADHQVHLDVGEADAVDGPQFPVVLGDQV